ncbi:MAG: type II secretion system major pseudopilin GspG [Phycisphaerales bacterium]|nr:type II secretion system major pseudopilin GspG [Phycisphaerales bacterium]
MKTIDDRRGSRRSSAARRGFTLIEAIVVVLILGVLAAVIAPRLISRVGQSKQSVAASNAATLASSVNQFLLDHGNPGSGAGIDILWDRPSDVQEENWEPYVQSAEALVDPWGNQYVLRIPGEKNHDFDVVSYGADGRPGGEGENEDIVKP